MASAELTRRVEKVVGYRPLSEMGGRQPREFHEALLDAGSFENLPGKWQAAVLNAEQNRRSSALLAATRTRSQRDRYRCQGCRGRSPLGVSSRS